MNIGFYTAAFAALHTIKRMIADSHCLELYKGSLAKYQGRKVIHFDLRGQIDDLDISPAYNILDENRYIPRLYLLINEQSPGLQHANNKNNYAVILNVGNGDREYIIPKDNRLVNKNTGGIYTEITVSARDRKIMDNMDQRLKTLSPQDIRSDKKIYQILDELSS